MLVQDDLMMRQVMWFGKICCEEDENAGSRGI